MRNIQLIKYLSFFVSIAAFFILSYHFLISPPKNFPINSTVPIEGGSFLSNISKNLKDDGIIRSELALQFFAVLFGGDRHIVAGDYFFDSPISVWNVAYRIALGRHHRQALKVTIPEGTGVKRMADLLSETLINFDQDDFILKAKPQEGYLFPDTYFFYTTTTSDEVLKVLRDNFDAQIKTLKPDIEKSGHTLNEIIIMASLIEEESGGPDDKSQISGILWKRIEKGIRLQVDAWPETYDKAGLPEAPISNPGLEAIKASIHPVETAYLFYLHDKDGKIHYAKTFEEHKLNILKYL
jgi:UPF0755 protein